MALQQQDEEDLAFPAAYEDDTPTPAGWKRKLVPRIGKSMVPVRTDVIFVTPSGEEFKSRAQLQRYLKANKGSPSLSEFIWIVEGTPERSTRSKSAPMLKLEVPAKAERKKKPAVVTSEVGNGKPLHGKHRGTRKAQKPEQDMSIVKGKYSKNTDTDTQREEKDEGLEFTGSSPVSAKRKSLDMETLCEGQDEGVEFTGSSPASAKRKRSAKVRANKDSAPTLMDAANTNGVAAETSGRENKADETVKKVSTNKADKRTRSKGRTMAKKGNIAQDRSDDVRQEAADVSSAGATNAEPDSNGKGFGDHSEEGADVDQNNETTAVNE
ncbi:hypothetical protein L7F22_015981 [Adiantum nelumboides]|nr:hypothetical protein [Adiantum nelumboides]